MYSALSEALPAPQRLRSLIVKGGGRSGKRILSLSSQNSFPTVMLPLERSLARKGGVLGEETSFNWFSMVTHLRPRIFEAITRRDEGIAEDCIGAEAQYVPRLHPRLLEDLEEQPGGHLHRVGGREVAGLREDDVDQRNVVARVALLPDVARRLGRTREPYFVALLEKPPAHGHHS